MATSRGPGRGAVTLAHTPPRAAGSNARHALSLLLAITLVAGLAALDAPRATGVGSAAARTRPVPASRAARPARPAAVPRPAEALTPPADRPPPARVQLDRLRWSPDGALLALEARYLDGADVSIDTLLVDLTEGSVRPTAPTARAFALSADGTRLAIASHYALWCGPAGDPAQLLPLQRLDPTRDVVERLGFNPAGDTLLVALRRDGGAGLDLSRIPLAAGGRPVAWRAADGAPADSAWARFTATEPVPVRVNPFPGLYEPVRTNLFFLERTDRDSPNGGAQWFFDLHHRNNADGSERVLARQIAPFACSVSPDSMWVAIAGAEYHHDYGGGVSRTLWLASPDGLEFSRVTRLGEPRADLKVTAMAWRAGRLWFLTPDGLWNVSPTEGRARRVRLGPPRPAWADELPKPARVLACFLPDTHADSTSALRQCLGLRAQGLPAWVAGPAGGPFQVALGAATDSTTLRLLLRDSQARSLVDDFPPRWCLATAEGLPLAYNIVRDPRTGREAWLTATGAPGCLAGELWLTERPGGARLRLIRAMSAPSRAAGAEPERR